MPISSKYKNENYLLIIVGPTAIGKTKLSVQIAKMLGTEIVSTDSRQFYKELNVGTAKPSQEELGTVKHHLINCLSIFNDYNVKLFERDALASISNIHRRSNFAIATGGSGLFVKTLCEGIDELPSISHDIRATIEMEYNSLGLVALVNELKLKDPQYYNIVDLENPRRVIRALEVIRSSNKTYTSFKTKRKRTTRPFTIIKIGLRINRDDLYRRINDRVDKMINDGLIDEAKKLYDNRHLNALQTVGYQELFPYFEGKYGAHEAIRLVKRNTRRYAKRQLTWFNKDRDITWFDMDKDDKIVISNILTHLNPLLD